MGEKDGSSAAASGASLENDILSQPETNKQSGFFSRVIEAFGSGDPDEAEGPDTESATRQPAHGLMNLRRMRVEDVSIPKADIISLPSAATLEEAVAVFKESGLTRLPVFVGTLDTPIGMLHLKDLALRHGFNGDGEDFDMKSALRPLLFVPPSMSIGVLLTKMQTERRHMALVIDEYGGVDGLVTIEDLIEQVVGEIEDEHDIDEGIFWTEEKPGCYLALAKTPLEDFEAEIGRSLTDHDEVDEEEIDTLGGLVFMLSGRVPARGELVVHPDGVEFEVMDADPRRIKRLRVRTGKG
ncbi:MAG: hemolysin family protein [Pseudomonadota bacterium]